jgi:hypothetical protein
LPYSLLLGFVDGSAWNFTARSEGFEIKQQARIKYTVYSTKYITRYLPYRLSDSCIQLYLKKNQFQKKPKNTILLSIPHPSLSVFSFPHLNLAIIFLSLVLSLSPQVHPNFLRHTPLILPVEPRKPCTGKHKIS